MSICVGNEYINNDNLKFTIVSKHHKFKTETFYNVIFENGYTTIAGRKPILMGSVKNKTHPSIFNKAYIGNINNIKSYYNGKAYRKWYSMLSRCYNVNDISHKSYSGVTVCDRWLCFSNFLEDISKIQGFDENKLSLGLLELDKDYNGTGKLYSLQTCKLINKSDNLKLQKHKMKEFLAIDPNGIEYSSWNQTEFAKIHKLTPRTIGKVLNGDLKSHKHWKFKYKGI